MQEKVSVVITTKNEEKNIENCLKSIQLQTWTNIEIIVVDNNSSDKTKELSHGYTKLVSDKGPERSAQRNHGLIDIATGVYGMFIDADMILTPNLVEACVNESSSNDHIALHIQEIVLGNGRLARARRFERSFYSGTCIDGVRFFRLDDFRKIGGFDSALPPGPEDWDLDKRFKQLGKLGLVSSGSFVEDWPLDNFIYRRGAARPKTLAGIFHNEDEQSLRRYLAKKSYYSGSMDPYKKKWPGDADVRKQLEFRYRYLVVFVERGGWRKLLKHPLVFSNVFGLRVLVGFLYLYQKTKLNLKNKRRQAKT
jgi:glycosyltransferase involved in cell wall biosynthesis